MNRSDLDDLLSYDTDALTFGGIGTFFLSGSAWIALEQFFGPDGVMISPLLWIFLTAIPFGLFMLWQAWRQHKKKRRRIDRIFDETNHSDTASTSGVVSGKNSVSR